MKWPTQKPIRNVPSLERYTGKATPVKYTLEVLDGGERWRVKCPDLSTFSASTFDEVSDFLRHHTARGY